MIGFEDPVTAVAALPLFAVPAFVLVSAALEYVIPPYWGDLFVLVGFFLAAQGVARASVLAVAAFGGSMLGAAVAYLLGRRFGVRVIRWVTLPRRRLRSSRRMEDLYRRFGERVLVANRFLPVVRGLFLYGAGALRLRFGPVMGFTAVSNAAWICLLYLVSLTSRGTWEQVESSFRQLSLVIGLVVTALVVSSVVLVRLRTSVTGRTSD